MSQNNIRPFTPEDIFYVVGVAKRFTEGRGKIFNEGSFCSYLLDVQSRGMILMMDSDGDTIGLCAILETEDGFTGNKAMVRTDIWIEPEYRGQGLTKLFYTRLKEIGDTLQFKEYSWEN